jgi:release factor glutamine methyltransferase
MSTAEADAQVWTVARLLGWTRDYLQRSGIESSRLCAEILLAHAMGCERIRLYTRHEEVPDEAVLARFRTLVKQAAGGRPIAYLTGTKEFFSLPFQVTTDVLIPRPETEILVERTIDLVRKSPELHAILDLGTGSGCIAVSLARHLPAVALHASDISEAALAVARRNAERHGVGGRIEFRAGDLLAPWSSAGPFDVIVCNPPYVATGGSAPIAKNVRDFEPQVALFAGPEGLDVIRRVVQEAPAALRPGGHLLMEIGFDQAAAVRDLLAQAGWQDIVTYRDGGGHERVVQARCAPVGR